MGLPVLEELVIRENHISQLPALPETMSLIDASHNNIGSKGIHKEAFKVRKSSIVTITVMSCWEVVTSKGLSR